MQERWPELPLDAWRDTYATLHRWTQIVGKTRLALTPHINHWWNVTLYVTTRGLTTGTMYSGNIEIEVEFDFTTHELVIKSSAPAETRLPLTSKSVAVFYTEYLSALRLLGVDVSLNTTPNEIEDVTPFDVDEIHSTYDPEYANRHWRILLSADRVFSEFRSRYIGKTSPTHFFWGSFDLRRAASQEEERQRIQVARLTFPYGSGAKAIRTSSRVQDSGQAEVRESRSRFFTPMLTLSRKAMAKQKSTLLKRTITRR